MVNHNIPVVLVVAGKKIENIPCVIKNLSLQCDFKLFYIICPQKDLKRAWDYSSELIEEKVYIVNEEFIIPGLNLAEVKKLMNFFLSNFPENNLPGWYLQQFLKMGFAKYAPDQEYYLIWDADTLLTRPISFFEEGKILLTQGNEFHSEYFSTIQLLFKSVDIQPVSHISQHLMVRTKDMIDLIDSLGTPECKWWRIILKSLKGKTPQQFSEYETYTNYYLSKRPESYSSIQRDWFRYGNSYFGCGLTQANISKFSNLYDFVAFEEWDFGVMRRIRSHIIVIIQIIIKTIKPWWQRS